MCRIFAGSKFSAVVHCAGVNQDRLLLRENPATFAAALQAHATSAFLISRSGLQMLPRGGQIVLVGSRTGERGGIGQCAYAAAKAATVGLMRTASREGMAAGISVNAVYPGFTPSGLSSGMRDSALVGRERENLLEGAEAAPSFAAFVAWLLEKPRGTGQIFRPDCRG